MLGSMFSRNFFAVLIFVKKKYLWKLKAEGVQVFTIKAELHGVGLTTAQTPFGHTVPVYDLELSLIHI